MGIDYFPMPASTASPASVVRAVHAALASATVGATGLLVLLRRAPGIGPAPLLLYAVFAIAAIMFAGALVVAGRIPRLAAGEDEAAWWRVTLPRAVAVWAMLEGPAFLAAMAHFLTGSWLPLVVPAVALFLFGLTAPGRLREG